MELKRDPQLRFNEDVKKVQMQLNCVRGSWDLLNEDGKFGPLTEKAVIEYQKSRQIHPPKLGEIGEETYARLMEEQILNGRYSIITNATRSSKIDWEISSNPSGILTKNVINPHTIISHFEKLQMVKEWSDPSEKSLAYILSEWEKAIKKQHNRIVRQLNKFPKRKSKRTQEIILKKIKGCEKFLKEAQHYGVNVASKVFANNLSKEQAIMHISDLGKAIANNRLYKTLGTLTGVIKHILQPVVKCLNKIPGLKYISVIDKIVEGTCAIFRGDYNKAFEAYLDGIRLLVEQVIIDAAVIALVAIGGWVALVLAIAIIAVTALVDYFLFNDDPDKSWLPTTNLTTKVKPILAREIYKFGEREMRRDRENIWRGPKY